MWFWYACSKWIKSLQKELECYATATICNRHNLVCQYPFWPCLKPWTRRNNWANPPTSFSLDFQKLPNSIRDHLGIGNFQMARGDRTLPPTSDNPAIVRTADISVTKASLERWVPSYGKINKTPSADQHAGENLNSWRSVWTLKGTWLWICYVLHMLYQVIATPEMSLTSRAISSIDMHRTLKQCLALGRLG